MVGNGTISSGFPIFFQPIRETLGINYAQMSLVFGLARAEGGMGGPIVGWLVDRYGSRRFVILGGLLAAIGFIRRRALAMSTLMTAFAGGGAIVVPLLGIGISNLGWRQTLLYAGIFVGLISFIVSLVIRSKPEDMGLLPDGDLPKESADQVGVIQDEDGLGNQRSEFTVRQALRTKTFWLMLLGVVTRVSATNAIIVHLFPILEQEGLGPQTASFYASFMFFLAIPLRFLLGVAGDKLAPRKLLFFGMNLGAVSLLALLWINSIVGLLIFIFCLAIVEGVTSVNWIMLGDYFGRGRFASLMGFMSVFHNIGLVITPIYAGWIKDTTGSYDLVLATLAPLFVVSAFAFALSTRPAPPTSLKKN